MILIGAFWTLFLGRTLQTRKTKGITRFWRQKRGLFTLCPTLLLKEDERVYTIKRDVASVSGTSVVKGSVIDIAIQLKKADEYGVILEKVRVIGVRDRNGDEVKEGAAPYVILLAVDVADVALLLRAEEEGKLVLLPRSIHESS